MSDSPATDALEAAFALEAPYHWAADCALRHLPTLLAAAMERETAAGCEREFASWLCGYSESLKTRDEIEANLPSAMAAMETARADLDESLAPMTLAEFAERYGLDLEGLESPVRRAYPWRPTQPKETA